MAVVKAEWKVLTAKTLYRLFADRKMEVLSAKTKTSVGFWNVRTMCETASVVIKADARFKAHSTLKKIRERAHTQLVTEHSAIVVSAH